MNRLTVKEALEQLGDDVVQWVNIDPPPASRKAPKRRPEPVSNTEARKLVHAATTLGTAEDDRDSSVRVELDDRVVILQAAADVPPAPEPSPVDERQVSSVATDDGTEDGDR